MKELRVIGRDSICEDGADQIYNQAVSPDRDASSIPWRAENGSITSIIYFSTTRVDGLQQLVDLFIAHFFAQIRQN